MKTLLLIAGVDAKQCKALAMAGGGSKGAYEAGVLYGMIRSGDKNSTKFAYDVVTGVSIGSVNSAGVSLWQPGTEWDMV